MGGGVILIETGGTEEGGVNGQIDGWLNVVKVQSQLI